jgi:hypothetical protein
MTSVLMHEPPDLWQLIDENGFLYATPSAPHTTRKCALCNQGEESPNVVRSSTASLGASGVVRGMILTRHQVSKS